MEIKVIIALLAIFLVLFAAGVIVYSTFFAIHKLYFRREIKLIKKYNELVNSLNGINIFRFKVLAKNEIGKKLDFDKYINIYETLRENSSIIKSNIAIAESELSAFNLNTAKVYIDQINKDLNTALADMKALKEAYLTYTTYNHSVDDVFQKYSSIFQFLEFYFNNCLQYHDNFNKLNALFKSTRKTLESVPDLSLKFDYKKTIDTILDLGRKLNTLANAILLLLRFQIVDKYLLTTKEKNDDLVQECYDEIATTDLQKLQNLTTLYTHAYHNFVKNYKNLELGKAQYFALQALDAVNQINHFTYIHVSTPKLISISLNEIKDQTDRILANRSEIIASIKDLKQYFILDPAMIDNFDSIEKNVNYIAVLNNAANHVNYRTHTEKIKAIKDLDNIANQIVIRKEQIANAMDHIDIVLGNIVKTVTDLNDLYIYYWQLLTVIKKYAPTSAESNDMQNLIKGNLHQLENYSKQIVSEANPDFDTIAHEVGTIVEQSQQIFKKMTSTVVLKSYASRLFIYANRYKRMKDLTPAYEKANAAFKAKNYALCIEILLSLVKTAKKLKKKRG